jgi:hypothetical protein
MGLTGFAIGIFVMSWNISTFILHTRHIRFLATTAQPFLKYCINNAVIPLFFLIFYFVKAIQYDVYEELLSPGRVVLLMISFLTGFIVSILIAFGYFFGADKNIYRRLGATINKANEQYFSAVLKNPLPVYRGEIRVDWFFSASLGLRKPRDVRHYSEAFLNTIFKQHHLAAVLAVLLAFIFLVSVGYLSDSTVFLIPAAASITIFFAILIGVAGAFSLFLRSWSIPVIILLYLIINGLNKSGVIDLRNRAYGINYDKKLTPPAYNKEAIEEIASPANIEMDKQSFVQTLNEWKKRQHEEKPVMFIINVSGGGNRSAAFTLNILQRLDSVTQGKLMQHTMLISGASGGMLGAAYFRGLYFEKLKGSNINLQDHQYADNISRDLLNPLFSSFITRDIMGPAARFDAYGYEYVKDRAYAFEQKLNRNTKGVLDKRLADYRDAEIKAQIPTVVFNSTISRDGRRLFVGTRPQRYLMQAGFDTTRVPAKEIDAVDYVSFFNNQNPLNLSVLSALRMNATFPYVLPTVWLPSDPVIDVLDAGLRDNFGQETTFRFINVFRDWLEQNTSKVIVLQIRDRQSGDWDHPFENNSISGFVTKPLMLMQNNWFRMQTYSQIGQLDYLSESLGPQFYRFSFQYIPSRKDASASLSFHLTASEKKDIAASLNSSVNTNTFNRITNLLEENSERQMEKK